MKPISIGLILSIWSCGVLGQFGQSEQELVQFTIEVLKRHGEVATKNQILSGDVLPGTRKLAWLELLGICERINHSSVESMLRGVTTAMFLRDAKVPDEEYEQFRNRIQDLLARWKRIPPLSPNPKLPVELLSSMRAEFTDALSRGLVASERRHELKRILAEIKRARNSLRFLIVQFPDARLTFYTPDDSLVGDLLNVSDPETLYAGPVVKDYEPTDSTSDLDHKRNLAMIETGTLVYVCSGQSVLVTIIYDRNGCRYHFDPHGKLSVELCVWPTKLIKILDDIRNKVAAKSAETNAPVQKTK